MSHYSAPLYKSEPPLEPLRPRIEPSRTPSRQAVPRRPLKTTTVQQSPRRTTFISSAGSRSIAKRAGASDALYTPGAEDFSQQFRSERLSFGSKQSAFSNHSALSTDSSERCSQRTPSLQVPLSSRSRNLNHASQSRGLTRGPSRDTAKELDPVSPTSLSYRTSADLDKEFASLLDGVFSDVSAPASSHDELVNTPSTTPSSSGILINESESELSVRRDPEDPLLTTSEQVNSMVNDADANSKVDNLAKHEDGGPMCEIGFGMLQVKISKFQSMQKRLQAKISAVRALQLPILVAKTEPSA